MNFYQWEIVLCQKLHLKQPGLTYSAYGPFTENKKMIKKIKETSDSRYTYQKEQDKTCRQDIWIF